MTDHSPPLVRLLGRVVHLVVAPYAVAETTALDGPRPRFFEMPPRPGMAGDALNPALRQVGWRDETRDAERLGVAG